RLSPEFLRVSLHDALPIFADRQRAIGGTADETHDLGGLLDQVPALAVDAGDAGLVVGLDLHQDIAREELALGTALLAGTHLHHRSEEHTSELQSRENLVCR